MNRLVEGLFGWVRPAGAPRLGLPGWVHLGWVTQAGSARLGSPGWVPLGGFRPARIMCDLQLRKVITFSSELRFWVFLDFMESPLSQLSSRTTLDGSGCLSRPRNGRPGK